MKLPADSIGISDVLAYRECPRRMSYAMRRHLPGGGQSDEATPEAGGYATDYGSAIHRAIEAFEDDPEITAAVQTAWNEWGHRLDPTDLLTLRADMDTYQARDITNTRTVLNEGEIKVPLMRWRGRQIFFRAKIDRLYERLDAPGVYVAVDYKSSRTPKSDQEVREDLQLWAYNWSLTEYFPEIIELHQIYDQLRYGQIPTRKTAEARKRIHEWLVVQATAILEDEDVRDDGLLRPKKNEWCAWCPVLESCAIIPFLTEYARVRIAALAPAEKVGRKTVLKIDQDRIEDYVGEFAEAKDAVKILTRYVESLAKLLKDMPATEREALGYRVREDKNRKWTPRALADLHTQLGERFYDLVRVTKTGLEAELADEPELLSWALSEAEDTAGSSVLVAAPVEAKT